MIPQICCKAESDIEKDHNLCVWPSELQYSSQFWPTVPRARGGPACTCVVRRRARAQWSFDPRRSKGQRSREKIKDHSEVSLVDLLFLDHWKLLCWLYPGENSRLSTIIQDSCRYSERYRDPDQLSIDFLLPYQRFRHSINDNWSIIGAVLIRFHRAIFLFTSNVVGTQLELAHSSRPFHLELQIRQITVVDRLICEFVIAQSTSFRDQSPNFKDHRTRLGDDLNKIPQ